MSRRVIPIFIHDDALKAKKIIIIKNFINYVVVPNLTPCYSRKIWMSIFHEHEVPMPRMPDVTSQLPFTKNNSSAMFFPLIHGELLV